MNAPRFSIVMPVLNSEQYIGSAIESVLGQTFGDFELLISDDGSTDSTVEVASRHANRDKRVRLLRRTQGTGPGGNRNFALSRARASWVSFLDSDDLWPGDHLRVCEAALRAYPDAVFFFGDYRRFEGSVAAADAATLEQQRFFDGSAPYVQQVAHDCDGIELTRLVPELFLKHCCLRYCPISTQTVTLRRETLASRRIKFHERWRINEDFHAWMQMLEAGPAIAIRHVLAYYRRNQDGLTSDPIRYFEGMATSHGEWMRRIWDRLDRHERVTYRNKVAGFMRSAAWTHSREGRVMAAAGAHLRAFGIGRQPADLLGIGRTALRAAFWRTRVASGDRRRNHEE